MAKVTRNEGLVQTGGTIKAEQIAVGRNAQVSKTVQHAGQVLEQKGLDEVRDKLEALLQALESNADRITAQEEVFDTAEAVAKELARSKPNRLTLKSMLEAIAEHAKTATTVVAAVGALKAAVLAVL